MSRHLAHRLSRLSTTPRRVPMSVLGGLVLAVASLPMAAQATTRTVAPDYQPDAMVKLSGDAQYVGGNVYNAEGTDEYRSVISAPGTSLMFVVKVQNDGNVADVFRLHGMSTNNNFKIKYLKGASGTTDITTAVVNGTYNTASIAKGSAVTVRVKVTIKSTARLYSSIVARLRTVSTTSTTPSEDKDTVLPIVTAE
jgi:hypothetical protein